jgi:cytochrome c-type biogenesis protein CcmH
LVARYGEFVLLNPRFNWRTAMLWAAPATVLLIGAAGLVVLARRSRRRQAEAAAAPQLTPQEAKRVAELMRGR